MARPPPTSHSNQIIESFCKGARINIAAAAVPASKMAVRWTRESQMKGVALLLTPEMVPAWKSARSSVCPSVHQSVRRYHHSKASAPPPASIGSPGMAACILRLFSCATSLTIIRSSAYKAATAVQCSAVCTSLLHSRPRRRRRLLPSPRRTDLSPAA